MLSQLHLSLGLSRLGTHGKDVEYQTGTVQYLHLQFFLDVAQLLCRQFVVEDDHAQRLVSILAVLDILLNLLKLATAHVGHRARTAHPLGEPLDDHSPRRLGQELQLVQVFLGLSLVLLVGNQSHQHRRLGLRF